MEQTIKEVNGHIDHVTITATYANWRELPRVGQRRRFGNTGNSLFLVLDKLEARRIGSYDEDKRLNWSFRTTETWAGYYDF